MEKKVLFNVLEAIRKGDKNLLQIAPDKQYLDAIQTLGFAVIGWDDKLTDLGRSILETLRNQIQRY